MSGERNILAPAALALMMVAAVLVAGGCQPGQKAERASDSGVVDFDGEYTQPSDTTVDQTTGSAEAQRPLE